MEKNKGLFFERIQRLIEAIVSWLTPKKPAPIRIRIENRRR